MFLHMCNFKIVIQIMQYSEGDRRTYEMDNFSLMNTEDALLYEEILQQLSMQMGQEDDAVVVWNLQTQYEAMKVFPKCIIITRRN